MLHAAHSALWRQCKVFPLWSFSTPEGNPSGGCRLGPQPCRGIVCFPTETIGHCEAGACSRYSGTVPCIWNLMTVSRKAAHPSWAHTVHLNSAGLGQDLSIPYLPPVRAWRRPFGALLDHSVYANIYCSYVIPLYFKAALSVVVAYLHTAICFSEWACLNMLPSQVMIDRESRIT